MTICDFPIGSTIRRVRVQGSFSFSMVDDDPGGTDFVSETVGTQQIVFGVWAGYDGATTPSQTPPISGSLDDRWVFWDQMTLQSLNMFETPVPDIRWVANWTFANGDNDSVSSRTNNTVDSTIELAWGFVNVAFDPMTDVRTHLHAFYNFSMTWAVLMDLPS